MSILKSSDKDRYKREFDMLNMVNHPSIVSTNGYFYDAERFYLIMEYCRGGDMLAAVNKKRLAGGLVKFTER